MMTSYTGNGAYCFTNSLHMCLRHEGLDPRYTTGILECLGGMAVGASYHRWGDTRLFFPSPAMTQPDRAIDDVLAALGWTCTDTRGGTEAEAAERLRSLQLPAQLGPCNMGHLTYNPNYAYLDGSDHYVTLLGAHNDSVQVHDPAGYPYARLPFAKMMEAWSAVGVDYGPSVRPLAYVARTNFFADDPPPFDQVLQRGLTHMRELLSREIDGPNSFSGPAAIRALAEDIAAGHGPKMRDHLVWFALPLGARRSSDAADFMRLCGEGRAEDLMYQRAYQYGVLQHPVVHGDWPTVLEALRDLAKIETAVIAALVQ